MEIILNNLTHSFFEGKQRIDAIVDINLTLNTNEIIGITGQTGSGKSTLIEHLNLLLTPTIGNISIDGEVFPHKKMKANPVRKKVGMVFQFPEYQLFAETVLKDVMFGPSNFKDLKPKAKELALDALKLLNVPDSYLEKSPLELSGGWMRKVAIAGILAMQPETLIFDEPTRGLDPQARNEIIEIIHNLNIQGKMIVVVTHDMDLLVQLATRSLVMHKGKLIYDLPTRELFKQSNLQQYSIDYPKATQLYLDLTSKLNLEVDKTNLPLTLDEVVNKLETYYKENPIGDING